MTTADNEKTPDGGDETRTQLLVVAAAIAVALSLGLGITVLVDGGASLSGREPEGPTPQELAAEVTVAWLEAWEDGDGEAMAALAGGDPRVAEAVTGMRDELRVGAMLTDVGAPTTVAADERSAAVPFATRMAIGSLGTWSYEGRVELTAVDLPPEEEGDGEDTESSRSGGRNETGGPRSDHQNADGDEERQLGVSADGEVAWQVAFRPAVLHPALGDDGALELRVVWPERAGITAADGTPLPAPGVPALNGQVVGATAPASPERAAELGAPYEEGHVVGVSGLQAAHERRLAGVPTGEIVVAGTGQPLRAFSGESAEPVQTTFDLRLQAAAEATLSGVGKPAALVAVRPSTHEVVAVAGAPTGGFGRALYGRYPPGSTFKVVTSTGLIANGTTPDTPTTCPETADIAGRTFRNAEGAALGDILFRRAFYESCNTAFVQLADELTAEQLVAAAEAHGFNDEWPDAGLPVAGGSYPMPEGRIDQAASAIGQGRILASPLQMAVVAANVAAGGYRPPRLVAGPVSELQPLPGDAAPVLQELMRLVVAQGTATSAQLPGEPVRGKTGTAEFGTERPPRTHAWFIGYRGDLAIAVVVEDGGFGGAVAAPLAKSFFERAG